MHFKIPIDDFNLEATLDSGQVFGFAKHEDGVYEGILAGHPIRLHQLGKCLDVESDVQNRMDRLIRDYFDLERDLMPVYQHLGSDERLIHVLKQFKGLRLIHQSPWEALACFIISSNNNIKRIQGIWKRLTQHFDPHKKTFPKPQNISEAGEEVLRHLGLGYRAPFLHRAAQFVFLNPKEVGQIQNAPYPEAKERLMELPGVGPKVADCILLYGFQKYEAFPVDVWVLRVMRKLYFRNRTVNERKVTEFGQKRWGAWAGYIQQYLFHGARTGCLVL